MERFHNTNEIKTKVEELEELLKNNEDIDIKDIESLESQLSSMDIAENSIEYLLRHKLLKLRKEVLQKSKEKLTKWDLFVDDIKKIEGFDEIKTLVEMIDERKDDTISKEELDIIEKEYSKILPELHSKFSSYERDRAVKEFNKKIRLFTNRLSRVIEEDFGAWIKQLRLQKGYSLKELESISGVTASYIHRIESGSRKTPSVPIAERLAIGLGVKPEQFLKMLNISTVNNDTEDVKDLPLAQALAITPFTINDEKATTAQKNAIIELVSKVLDIKWSNESKVQDSIELMSLIDGFKKVIPNNESNLKEVAVSKE